MSDITVFCPQPTPITILGKVYNVMPFTLNEMSKLQVWIDRNHPNPFLSLDLSKMDPATRKDVLYAIRSYRPPKIGTDEATEELQSSEGSKEMIFIALSRADNTFTREKLDEIIGSMTLEGFMDVAEKVGEAAFGRPETPKDKKEESQESQ